MVEITIKTPGFDKLVEYAASGVGSVVGPMLAPWKATRKAEASRIEAQGNADCMRIIAEAQSDAQATLTKAEGTQTGVTEIQSGDVRQWVQFQEKKRLSNIRSVIHRTAEDLGEQEAPGDAPDHDWTARFFEAVQDVSSEEMQELWARLLSGEILDPKSVSIQTIAILRNMSRQDAETFTTFSTYEISGIVHEGSYRKLAAPLPDHKLLNLGELGLIHAPKEVFGQVVLNDQGVVMVKKGGRFLLIEGSPGTKIEIPGWIYTRPGNTLAGLCRLEPDMQYLGQFARFLTGSGSSLSIAPVRVHSQHGELMHKDEATLIPPA